MNKKSINIGDTYFIKKHSVYSYGNKVKVDSITRSYSGVLKVNGIVPLNAIAPIKCIEDCKDCKWKDGENNV